MNFDQYGYLPVKTVNTIVNFFLKSLKMTPYLVVPYCAKRAEGPDKVWFNYSVSTNFAFNEIMENKL